MKVKLNIFITILYFLLLFTLVYSIQTTHVTPTANATYDLGNSTDMYRDLWISRNAYIGGTLKVEGESEFYDNMKLFGNFNTSNNVTVGEDINLNSSIRHINSNQYMYYDEDGTLVYHIGD